MSIISSALASVTLQRAGRRRVEEVHTDHTGSKHQRTYLADADADVGAALAAFAVTLGGNLRLHEIITNIQQAATFGMFATITLTHSTAAENGTALRAVYQFATELQAVMIGEYLNTLTNPQLMNVFGMTNTQVNNLRTNKLVPAANAAATIRGSTGA
jgi:hypothetical protein